MGLTPLFPLQYGLFYEKEDLRRFWFNPSLCEAEKEFELIGCVIGLAIFHGHILDFRLPNVIFKKLLEKPTGLEDLAEVRNPLFSLLERERLNFLLVIFFLHLIVLDHSYPFLFFLFFPRLIHPWLRD